MAGSSSQNQGMLIAMIIFVILMVISMGLAVLFMSQSRELATKLTTAEKDANASEKAMGTLQGELDELKGIVMASPTKQDYATRDQIKARYKADLDKFGNRLKAIDSTHVTSTYTQLLDAALTIVEKKNLDLTAANNAVAEANAKRDEFEGSSKAQVMQFEMMAKTANDEKAAMLKKLEVVEGELRTAQQQLVDERAASVKKVDDERTAKQAIIEQLNQQIVTLQAALLQKDKFIETVKVPDYAATYDGKILRVIPTSRTVWINVGTFDNLKKHISFSVQPQGVQAGTSMPPKAKIEVVKLLDDHMAECRIVEDDLSNPIMAGDNIYTNLWDPGQKTRFGFAGKIDLNDDGTDDMEEVHSMVARSGGQIDVEVVNGVTNGELSVYTRYLVLGAIPADKPSADAYHALLDQATKLGVQRIPLPVFMDQIGYPKTDRRRVVFGGGSQTGTVAMDPPDGGQRISSGSVSPIFKSRSAPQASPSGSAY